MPFLAYPNIRGRRMSEVKGHLQLHSENKANLRYMRLSLKKAREKEKRAGAGEKMLNSHLWINQF